MKPIILTQDQFAEKFNRVLLSIFFNLSVFDDGPLKIQRLHRQFIDSQLWFLNLFVIAHEIGHIWKGHVDRSEVRAAQGRPETSSSPITILRRSHDQEFEADSVALDLILLGENRGLCKQGVSPDSIWPAAYMAIGWFFSIQCGIENLAKRIGLSLTDSHPPAIERRQRILARIAQTKSIDLSIVNGNYIYHNLVVNSAETGPLPKFDSEAIHEINMLRALLQAQG